MAMKFGERCQAVVDIWQQRSAEITNDHIKDYNAHFLHLLELAQAENDLMKVLDLTGAAGETLKVSSTHLSWCEAPMSTLIFHDMRVALEAFSKIRNTYSDTFGSDCDIFSASNSGIVRAVAHVKSTTCIVCLARELRANETRASVIAKCVKAIRAYAPGSAPPISCIQKALVVFLGAPIEWAEPATKRLRVQ
mmetsp:Transcript_25583/g.55595  ORF Transcript_25583/g.55595 Transcript_25583/m.55595 type:complete len:193 (+) Transcript_25583:2-580(+)